LALSTTYKRYASSLPTATNPQSAPEDVLTWDRFFNLRRRRRYLNLGSSVITASTAIGIFGPVIASQDIDGWAANVMGLDPIMVLGATTFAVAMLGWLCGPSFGTAVFKVWAGRRGWNQAIAEVRYTPPKRLGCADFWCRKRSRSLRALDGIEPTRRLRVRRTRSPIIMARRLRA
jgi:polyferredoxin